MNIHALWLSASVLAFAGGGVAGAQPASPRGEAPAASSVPEVVVTADRRTTNLQKTAIAATVLTQSDLIRRGVFTVDQLQFVAPSLTVDNFGQGNDFDIRGIGKGEHNTQTSTGVITYRDGVATFPGYFQEEPYFDIANVEVLRGPQGTFSGQNATGGAVIVTTRNPVIGGGYDGYLLAHYGNYDDAGAQGAINLPISDTLAARVAFDADYRNSFYHVTGPWTGDPNLKWGSARLSWLWTPTPSLRVLSKTDYDYLYNGNYFGDAIINPLTRKVNPTRDLFNFSNNGHESADDRFMRSILQVDYTAWAGIDFRSVSGYQQGKTSWQGDIDGTDLPAPNYSINESVDEELFSEEFNIISPSDKPITWILGAYYDRNDYAFPVGRFDIGVPAGGIDEQLNGVNHTYTAAGFGQISFKLPAGFQLQVGGRYSRWSTYNRVNWLVPEFLAFGYHFFQNETYSGQNFTGKVALDWNLNYDNFLYAFVATGAKPGGLNGALYFGGGTFPPPFQQEYVTDYEIGWKSSLLDNHLHTQLGFYYNNFDHFQVIVPIPNNPTQSTEFNNPNPTKLYGVEASAQAAFGGLSLDAGLGLEHSALGTFYTEDPRGATGGACNQESGPATALCINLGGHPQTYAPDLTFNVGASYNYRLSDGDTLTPSLSFSYISHQWGTLFDNVAAGDYLAARNILGASLAWTHGSIVATLYGSNLLDDHYVSALLPPIRLAGAPRQFGVSVMKTF
ncbi:MAG TPA: TonB-dependent receptor plug domain-containing protein [Caulobacteraceae bacterium]|nr:TonB-dependent receptor plug domain-containing protein [Caulobacteraceae bacterium]